MESTSGAPEEVPPPAWNWNYLCLLPTDPGRVLCNNTALATLPDQLTRWKPFAIEEVKEAENTEGPDCVQLSLLATYLFELQKGLAGLVKTLLQSLEAGPRGSLASCHRACPERREGGGGRPHPSTFKLGDPAGERSTAPSLFGPFESTPQAEIDKAFLTPKSLELSQSWLLPLRVGRGGSRCT